MPRTGHETLDEVNVAEGIPNGDMGGTASAAAATASPAVNAGNDAGQARAQSATEGDTSGTQAGQASVPSGRLREETARARAAEERAAQYEQRFARQEQELAALRQHREETAPVFDRLRQAFAPEPEVVIDDPLVRETAELREQQKAIMARLEERDRREQQAELVDQVAQARKAHPLPDVLLGTVAQRIRDFQIQHRARPSAGQIREIVKTVSGEWIESAETHRKARDVPPPVNLADRVAPNIPGKPLTFKTVEDREKYDREHRGQLH